MFEFGFSTLLVVRKHAYRFWRFVLRSPFSSVVILLTMCLSCVSPKSGPAKPALSPSNNGRSSLNTSTQALDAQKILPAPQVNITPVDGKEFEALGLSALDIHVTLNGGVSETVMLMEFYNPHDRVLEGELIFPLPEGVTVSGYALNIKSLNDRMVDAVVVEKRKARVVFEKEVRKGVDPGIVEWVGGNSFRTRLYPIPAKGMRRVAIKTVRSLRVFNTQLSYALPLFIPASLKRLSLDVQLASVQHRDAAQVEWQGIAPITLQKKSLGLFGQRTGEQQEEKGWLVITLPQKGDLVAVQTDSFGDVSFAVQEVLGAPGAGSAQVPAHVVNRVGIFWDVSHSRKGLAHDRALNALQAYFEALKRPEITVVLTLFSNAIHEKTILTLKRGDITPLRSALQNVTYDGGTQLGVIAPDAKNPADAYWVVSDGLSGFGEAMPKDFVAPVYTLSLAAQANSAFLRWMSERSGGRYFDLNVEEPLAAARASSAAPLSVIEVKTLKGDVTSVFPKPGAPLSDTLMLYGVLLSKSADIEVVVGRAGVPSATYRYTIEKSQSTVGDTLARLRAQRRVMELSAFPKRNAQTLVALGKRYGLVTPGTSMIVLESLGQYVEHHIRPPSGLADMQQAYDEKMLMVQSATEKEQERKLHRVERLWENRVAWWEKKFQRTYRYRPAPAKKEAARERQRPRRRMASAAGMAAEADAAPMVSASGAMRPKADKAISEEVSGPEISLKPWSPDTPYLKVLDKTPKKKRYAVYIEQKEVFGSSPAFYLDCADFFFKKHDRSTGLRILSTITDLGLEDAALARVVAHKLAQMGFLKLSEQLFEDVLRWRPEEPQSYRDLGLVLAEEKQYARAIALLNKVVMNEWARFAEIELIALMEINRLIPKARAAGLKDADIALNPKLMKLLDVDIRISLSWDADLTDIDMWVIEPSGEKAYYGNNLSHIGGLVSRDFTQGYGPEEYIIRRAMPGIYKVQANYFGSRAQTLTGAVTIQLDLYTNYGRKNEKKKSITLRLSQAKETLTVGTLKF